MAECKGCRFFLPIRENPTVKWPSNRGNCRRFPPFAVGTYVSSGLARTVAESPFPEVGDDAWCGEWKAADG